MDLLLSLLLKISLDNSITAELNNIKNQYLNETPTIILIDNSTLLNSSKIIEIFSDNATIIVYNIEAEFPKDFTKCHVKPRNTIMYLDGLNIVKYSEKFREIPLWDSRRKILVVTKDKPKEILQELWSFTWAVNVVVMVESNPVSFFTWFPYKSIECGNVSTIIQLSVNNLFPEKIEKNFNGCYLTAVSSDIYPLVINANDSKLLYSEGVEVEVAKALVKKHNLTLKYLSLPGNSFFWDMIRPDGTFGGGSLKMIYENKVEITFGGLQNRWEFYRYADPAIPYVEDYLSWYVPIPKLISNIEKIPKAFSVQLWFFVLGVFIIIILFFIIVSIIQPQVDLSNEILNTLRAYLYSPVILPKGWFLKIFYLFVLIYSLHITTVYQSGLIYMLSNQVLETPITTIEQAVDRNLQFHFYEIHRALLNDSDNELWLNIERKNMYNFKLYLNYDTFVREQSGAFLGPKVNSLYYLRISNFVDEYDRTLMVELPQHFMSVPIIMVVSKGHPLVPLINDLVQKLLEGGFPEWWQSRFRVDAVVSFKQKTIALTTESLIAAFILLGAMNTLSFIIFIIEVSISIVFCKIKKWRKNRLQK